MPHLPHPPHPAPQHEAPPGQVERFLLELAALQGFPTVVDGKPLVLAGSGVSVWREHIGNAAPPPTARAIAEQMLVALVQADAEAMALNGGQAVWVDPMEDCTT